MLVNGSAKANYSSMDDPSIHSTATLETILVVGNAYRVGEASKNLGSSVMQHRPELLKADGYLASGD